MMNVYIGKRESSSVISTKRAPPVARRPPPEKVWPTIMNKPPKSQTPASIGKLTYFSQPIARRFTRKKVIRSVRGVTTVTITTSRPLNSWPLNACSSVSGSQNPAAPSIINLRTRDQVRFDHFIERMISHCFSWRNIAITLIDLAVSPPARAREKGNALEAPLGPKAHIGSLVAGETLLRDPTADYQKQVLTDYY